MGDIIFDIATQTITLIDKQITGLVKIDKKIEGTIVKAIGSSACYQGLISELDLSDTEITSIGYMAFCFCSQLHSVHFPESIVEIGDNSFGVTGLLSIHLPSNVQFFNGYSVNQCPKLDILTVTESNPYFVSVNNFIFSKNLTTLVRSPIHFRFEDIPHFNYIQVLDNCLFSGSFLARFIATSNLSFIARRGFHACDKLIYVDLSKATITIINQYTFHIVPNIVSIILPQTLLVIQGSSFYNNNVIRQIIIPPRVKEIGVDAFSLMESLSSIYVFTNHSFPSANIINDNIEKSVLSIHVQLFYPSDTFGGVVVNRDLYENAVFNILRKKDCSLQYTQSIIYHFFILFLSIFLL